MNFIQAHCPLTVRNKKAEPRYHIRHIQENIKGRDHDQNHTKSIQTTEVTLYLCAPPQFYPGLTLVYFITYYNY